MNQLNEAASAEDTPCKPENGDAYHPDELREAIVSLSGAHSSAIIQHGTWMLVAGEMLNSIVSHLPPQTRADIAGTFRERIERLLALGDDRALPSTYTGELLQEVNRYLKVLESK